MIRPYNLDEAVQNLGFAPSYRTLKHEADAYYSYLHGLVISDGYLFAQIYDPVEGTHESVSVDDLAEGWVYANGEPVGVEA